MHMRMQEKTAAAPACTPQTPQRRTHSCRAHVFCTALLSAFTVCNLPTWKACPHTYSKSHFQFWESLVKTGEGDLAVQQPAGGGSADLRREVHRQRLRQHPQRLPQVGHRGHPRVEALREPAAGGGARRHPRPVACSRLQGRGGGGCAVGDGMGGDPRRPCCSTQRRRPASSLGPVRSQQASAGPANGSFLRSTSRPGNICSVHLSAQTGHSCKRRRLQ